MNTYDIGDAVVLTATFSVAPTTVTLTLRAPDGTESTPAVSSTGGTSTATVVTTQAGIYRYRWEGTGAAVAAEEGAFRVRRRMVGGG